MLIALMNLKEFSRRGGKAGTEAQRLARRENMAKARAQKLKALSLRKSIPPHDKASSSQDKAVPPQG